MQNLVPLAPAEPSGWSIVASLAPVAALLAAGLVTFIGWRNLKHQQRALKENVRSDARNLTQKRLADARSEWWRRTQWALEAAASKDETMSAYGTGMLTLLAKSELASDEDKDLLDTAWQVDTAAADEESAEEFLRFADEFNNQPNLDDSPETGENESMKEADHG